MKYALLTFAFLFVGFAQAQKETKPTTGLKFTTLEIVRENIPYDSFKIINYLISCTLNSFY